MNNVIYFMMAFTVILIIYIYKKKFLTFGALLLGICDFTVVFLFGGERWLGMFFCAVILSLVVPKIFSDNKLRQKKEKRNFGDLIAISSACFIAAACCKFIGEYNWFAIFSMPLSYIVADIFSSEISIKSWKSQARLLSKGFVIVEHGTPGAISIAGLIYSLIGSTGVAGIYLFFSGEKDYYNCIHIIITGFLICFLESLFNDYANKFNIKNKINNELINTLFVLLSMICGICLSAFRV